MDMMVGISPDSAHILKPPEKGRISIHIGGFYPGKIERFNGQSFRQSGLVQDDAGSFRVILEPLDKSFDSVAFCAEHGWDSILTI